MGSSDNASEAQPNCWNCEFFVGFGVEKKEIGKGTFSVLQLKPIVLCKRNGRNQSFEIVYRKCVNWESDEERRNCWNCGNFSGFSWEIKGDIDEVAINPKLVIACNEKPIVIQMANFKENDCSLCWRPPGVYLGEI